MRVGEADAPQRCPLTGEDLVLLKALYEAEETDETSARLAHRPCLLTRPMDSPARMPTRPGKDPRVPSLASYFARISSVSGEVGSARPRARQAHVHSAVEDHDEKGAGAA